MRERCGRARGVSVWRVDETEGGGACEERIMLTKSNLAHKSPFANMLYAVRFGCTRAAFCVDDNLYEYREAVCFPRDEKRGAKRKARQNWCAVGAKKAPRNRGCVQTTAGAARGVARHRRHQYDWEAHKASVARAAPTSTCPDARKIASAGVVRYHALRIAKIGHFAL